MQGPAGGLVAGANVAMVVVAGEETQGYEQAGRMLGGDGEYFSFLFGYKTNL